MGEAVIVYGKSGAGKTRSLKEFNEDEIFLIKATNKRLPFRKKFKYEMASNDVSKIKSVLTRMVARMPQLKTVVIDDATFIMIDEFMKRHSGDKKGSSSFDLYNDIADNIYTLFKFITEELPDDVIVYVIMHEDTNDYGMTKISTIGKLLDEKVKVERMINVCLRCIVENKDHIFVTQSNGNDISKSPEDMFPLKIPNDLKAVDTAIRKFYELDAAETEQLSTDNATTDEDERETA